MGADFGCAGFARLVFARGENGASCAALLPAVFLHASHMRGHHGLYKPRTAANRGHFWHLLLQDLAQPKNLTSGGGGTRARFPHPISGLASSPALRDPRGRGASRATSARSYLRAGRGACSLSSKLPRSAASCYFRSSSAPYPPGVIAGLPPGLALSALLTPPGQLPGHPVANIMGIVKHDAHRSASSGSCRRTRTLPGRPSAPSTVRDPSPERKSP